MPTEAAIQPIERTSKKTIVFALGAGAVLYVALAAGCAAYLLSQAFAEPFGTQLSEFNKVAIGALIAVVGTGLTGLTAIYAATQQSATAERVADFNRMAANELAEVKAKVDASVAALKANSDESLARLKVALDAGQLAHRELWGSATTYFYALRSGALGSWDDASLAAAEAGMITAARHVIHVDRKMRHGWFNFWQRAQHIWREALTETEPARRVERLQVLFGEKISLGRKQLDLRDLHFALERTAKRALKNSGEPGESRP